MKNEEAPPRFMPDDEKLLKLYRSRKWLWRILYYPVLLGALGLAISSVHHIITVQIGAPIIGDINSAEQNFDSFTGSRYYDVFYEWADASGHVSQGMTGIDDGEYLAITDKKLPLHVSPFTGHAFHAGYEAIETSMFGLVLGFGIAAFVFNLRRKAVQLDRAASGGAVKKSRRALVLVPMFLTLASPSLAAENNTPTRTQALGEEFIIFQAGLAFLQHCREFEIHRKLHPRYTKNAVVMAKTLAKEIAAQDPSFSEKQAMLALSTQERDLEQSFNDFYAKGDKCQSSEAVAAAEHVTAFENASDKAFRNYLAGLKPRLVE